MPEQEIDSVQDPAATEHLSVVEEEDDGLRLLGQASCESDEQGVVGCLVEGRPAHSGNRDTNARQCGEDVRPEHAGLGVVLVEA